MATVALSTSPTQIDAGSSYSVLVANTGASPVELSRGGRLRPGQTQTVYPEGSALTAVSLSGAGQVTTTTVAGKPLPNPSDPAALAADPAFTATYAGLTGLRSSARVSGRVVAWSGDSITNGSQASNAGNTSFRAMVPKLSGMHRVASVTGSINGGTAGDRSDQLLARVPSIIAQGPQSAFVLIGTNDANQAVTLTTFASNVAAIVALYQKAGIPVAVGTVPPRASTATAAVTQLIRQYNLWLRLWAPTVGVPLVDTFAALVDTSTGYLSATYDSGDGIHPNDAGHLALAKAVAPVMTALATGTAIPDYPWLVQAPAPSTAEITGLVSNPLMAGAGGGTSTSLPTNWSDFAGVGGRISGNYTFDVVAASGGDLPTGQWGKMRLDGITNGSGGIRVMSRTLTATAFTAGDQLLIAAYLKCSDAAATGMALKLFNGNTGAALTSADTFQTATPGPVLYPYTVGAGVTSIVLGLVGSVTAAQDISYYIGAVNVFNLTQLGLTAYAK